MLRLAALVFAVVFLVVNLGNALHKGGDFDVFLDAGGRVLDGTPLYAGSSAGAGVTWPPAQAMLFAPLAAMARVHLVATRVCWYLLGLGALAVGVWAWTAAFAAGRWPDAAAVDRTSLVIWALLAIALPAQTNFEHQNMNPLLLGLTGLAAYWCARDRDGLGGAMVGVATALKAFPALLIIYFVCARRWRAAAVAIATAALLTALPVIVYGPHGAWDTFLEWIRLSGSGGWPLRSQNQSLFAMASRRAPSAAGVINLIGTLGLVALVVVIAMRKRTSATFTAEFALTLACAVIASPIAWNHYWVLMFPALVALYLQGATDRSARTAFWMAAVLITGLSPLTLGTHAFNVVREWSPNTIAGLLIVAGLARFLLGRRNVPGHVGRI